MKLTKVIVSVLALSMVLSLPAFACEKSHHHNKNNNTEVSIDASAESSSNDDAAADSGVEAAADAAIEEGFTLGEVNGQVYENPFFNVRLTAPEDFTFNHEGLMTLVDDYTSTPFAKDATKAFVQVILDNDYPVQLLNANNNKNASLDVYVGYVADNTDDYLNEKALIESKLDDIVNMYKNMGLTDVTTSVATTNFLGEEHPCMDVTGTIEGVNYNHKYVCIPKDGYVLVIGFGGFEQKDFAPIANATKLN
ncbi:hypothetical protein [Butyrivibrio sp. INlla21]|uniref:hypothetical protein n=1 Tax=Butyrivibrio sp. INlla21 TaxID=1520811 RepID=UPI0008DF0EC9|nr:hypothetical protein [Butyrivibrio sp. INlla21]SFU42362.1 hypothetical protein SAMN02910342_00442 [Butyrivibrio sp. INlla21]